MTDSVFEDAFNLLCGNKIGEGIHREVFECRIRPELVVKVEREDWRYFANVYEMKFWDDHCDYAKVAKWLAPCEFHSPDGRILLQRRTDQATEKHIPPNLPAFLTDVKASNFGWLDGRIVCHDYAMTIPNPSVRMKRVHK